MIKFDTNDSGIRAVNADPKKIWLSTAPTFDTTDWFSKELREKIDTAVERGKHNECFTYYLNDIFSMQEFYKQIEEDKMRPKLRIKNVIFNDPEKGLAMAICKKVLGSNDSQSNFNDIFKKWLPKKEEKKEPKVIGKIKNMTMTDKGLAVEAEITDPKFSFSINESLGILGE